MLISVTHKKMCIKAVWYKKTDVPAWKCGIEVVGILREFALNASVIAVITLIL